MLVNYNDVGSIETALFTKAKYKNHTKPHPNSQPLPKTATPLDSGGKGGAGGAEELGERSENESEIPYTDWRVYKTKFEEFTVKLGEKICVFGDVIHDEKSGWMIMGFPMFIGKSKKLLVDWMNKLTGNFRRIRFFCVGLLIYCAGMGVYNLYTLIRRHETKEKDNDVDKNN